MLLHICCDVDLEVSKYTYLKTIYIICARFYLIKTVYYILTKFYLWAIYCLSLIQCQIYIPENPSCTFLPMRHWFVPSFLCSQACLAATITFLGVQRDVTDFSSVGSRGFWFPGFACSSYEFGMGTNFSEYDRMQPWTGPLKHISRWELKEYVNRSFSMDGPCSTICGDINYNIIQLPDGTIGSSGVIVDPAADENSNNSVNRIMLNDGTPDSFVLSIVVDNCNKEHSPVNVIKARGEHLGQPVEPDIAPEPGIDAFNGVADLYAFRYDGFVAGDHIKIKFNGQAGNVQNGGGASFGGITFD